MKPASSLKAHQQAVWPSSVQKQRAKKPSCYDVLLAIRSPLPQHTVLTIVYKSPKRMLMARFTGLKAESRLLQVAGLSNAPSLQISESIIHPQGHWGCGGSSTVLGHLHSAVGVLMKASPAANHAESDATCKGRTASGQVPCSSRRTAKSQE